MIIDNIGKTLFDDMKATLKKGDRLNIAASCFSIYAYEALRETLEGVKEVRFLFTEPTFTDVASAKQQREFFIPKLNRERSLCGSEFEVKLRNELKQKAVARECADWIRRKATFKSNKTNEVIQGFATTDDVSYTPILGFTTVDLGIEKGNRVNTAIMKSEAPFARQFVEMFNYLWNDGEKRQTVTDEVIESITSAYRENSPEFIYFVTLYNIFHEFLEDISEDELPKEATGFRDSVIWSRLYDFQRDAVLSIINKLEKYNGCILADSVGLGKTFTALAVIKYYESRNHSVLVLCPKKLYQNWDTYRQTYVNNPLVKDKFGYKVLYHTDLSRESGDSNGVDLERLNWGAFDLVVIDESHNFRNGGKLLPPEDGDDDSDENMNRYQRLINKVIRAGVKTKVLMLSATPVNNRFNDLRNQLQIAYTDYAKGFDELVEGKSGLHDIFKSAQSVFNEWNSDNPDGSGSIADLQQRLDPRFFALLDAVTIARSRKHIQKYYNMAAIGKFPERLPPISRSPEIVPDLEGVFFRAIAETLLSIKLAVYTPSAYILPSRLSKYEKDDDAENGREKGLSLVGRERGILKLMFTQLLKRLESSVAAFRLTLEGIIALMDGAIAAVEEYKRGNGGATVEDYSSGDTDEDEDTAMVGQGSSKIAIADMNVEGWLCDLKSDREKLNTLLDGVKLVTPERDNKLATLLSDIKSKIANPINAGNRKVLVFTAFADTANYLYDSLCHRLKEEGLECGLVTGSGSAKTSVEMRRGERLDFNKVLTMFSPVSKERDSLYPKLKGKEIDILIATDCVSEGQNIQDADYLINYDIHWNPVRIIQRFGRIDRIGSRNERIQLVNYWPPMEIESYINLQGRVQSRAKAISLSSTGDDNIVSPESDVSLDYRSRQLREMRKSNTVMDLEDVNAGPNITDLGLNEFRMDLLEYIKDGHKVDNSPLGLHAVVGECENAPRGVIYVLKNKSRDVDVDRRNRIHPFYMVYVGDDGHVEIDHLKPKEMLDRLRLVCRGKSSPDASLCRDFNRETKDGLNMKRYSDLLGKAVESIVSGKEKSTLDGFYGGEQGDLFAEKNKLKGLDDFELVTFVVVR